MPDDAVRVQIEGRLATVVLDRPATGNAIDEQVALSLRDACDNLAKDDDVWVVLLTGGGDAFCLGTDSTALAASVPYRRLRVAPGVAELEKPVVCAVNGDAIGQGLELALACDIRISSVSAKLGLTQVKDGTMPWDGGTQRLPRLIGRSRATEMILTSRLVGAEEALEMGLVNQVVAPDELLPRAVELASTIAGHGPIAARYLKETVSKGMDLTLVQGLHLEADLNLILQSTADRAEGIQSFLERRKPHYRGD